VARTSRFSNPAALKSSRVRRLWSRSTPILGEHPKKKPQSKGALTLGRVPAISLTILFASLVVSAAPSPAAEPRVYAGIYLSDISGFDLREGRFRADLDVWLKWTGPKEPPALRFVNGEIESREEQERESDGDWHSVRWRVQGTFRGTFPLHAFPFDRQQLKLELALPEDTAHLSPDLGSSGMARTFSITGWEYEPFFRTFTGRQVVASDLGSIRNEGHSRGLESVTFILDLKRPTTSNLLRFMLPLAIILMMAFLVFAIPATIIDVRSAMGVTSLLSVVAFHFAMSGTLPDVPYLVAADRLFLTSYVLVLFSILETVVVFRFGESRGALTRTVDRTSAAVLSLIALGVGISVGTIPSRFDDPQDPPAAAPVKSGPSTVPIAASPRDELRVGVTSLQTLSSQGLNGLMRRGLTNLSPDGELSPHLADAVPSMTDESVRLLPDGGMLVRWRLRAGLRWSDGSPLRSSDLIYSLGLVPDPDRGEAKAVNDRTITIHYNRRLADALTDFPIYPEKTARAFSQDGGIEAIRQQNQTAPISSDGPYRMVSFSPGKEAVFERNPYFAASPPLIARIRVSMVSPEQIAGRLRDGTLDLVPTVPTSVIPELRSDPSATLHVAPDDSLLFLQPDLSVPWLADVRARRALLMALDRNAIANVYVGGVGRVGHTYRPDSAPDYAADAVRVGQSPVDAKKLLAQVSGHPTSVKLIVAEAPLGSGYLLAADAVAKSLEAIGLKVERVTVPANKANETFQKASHGGLFLHARRDRRPARFFNLPTLPGAVLDTRTPRPHFPAEVIDLVRQYESSLFPERRRLISMRLQRAFADSVPLLPLAFGAQVIGRAKSLQGMQLGPAGSMWWNVEAWTVGNDSQPQ
jgi:ABC-type transport system substrate-binding protein